MRVAFLVGMAAVAIAVSRLFRPLSAGLLLAVLAAWLTQEEAPVGPVVGAFSARSARAAGAYHPNSRRPGAGVPPASVEETPPSPPLPSESPPSESPPEEPPQSESPVAQEEDFHAGWGTPSQRRVPPRMPTDARDRLRAALIEDFFTR